MAFGRPWHADFDRPSLAGRPWHAFVLGWLPLASCLWQLSACCLQSAVSGSCPWRAVSGGREGQGVFCGLSLARCLWQAVFGSSSVAGSSCQSVLGRLSLAGYLGARWTRGARALARRLQRGQASNAPTLQKHAEQEEAGITPIETRTSAETSRNSEAHPQAQRAPTETSIRQLASYPTTSNIAKHTSEAGVSSCSPQLLVFAGLSLAGCLWQSVSAN